MFDAVKVRLSVGEAVFVAVKKPVSVIERGGVEVLDGEEAFPD